MRYLEEGVQSPRLHATPMLPRARLAFMRALRDTPKFLLVLVLAVLLLTLSRCYGCACAASAMTAPTPSLAAAAPEPAASLGSSEAELEPEPTTAEAEAATGGQLRLSEVVVGLMTAQRFHGTRCRMQSATWLQRMRRVIFFSDSTAEAVEELQAPVMAHAFDAAPLERIFTGGNWRALPILREMAQMFFTDEALAGFAARGEPAPRWAWLADDDSFAFHSALLDTLRRYDDNKKQYLGYAFIAAPHLEGIIPGKRQPLFANGGAGIAVSRAAMRAVIPHLARCEQEYKWNWPGDIRVAQCFVDAGVKLEWVHTFHSENPHVIIEKAKPPPGSVPVGLTLPPLSFHHVDVNMLPQLERMQIVRVERGGRPYYVDFAPLAFQPLAARSDGAQLQLHFGYQVLLAEAEAEGGQGGQGQHGLLVKRGEHLASFRAVGDGFRQSFTGGECKEGGRLLGGMSATVDISCGGCGGPTVPPPGKLEVCGFRREGCAAHVSLAMARCPPPQPVLRRGLDGGARRGASDVVFDGAPRAAWARGCGRGGRAACAEVEVSRVHGGTNLTLHFRSLRGAAALRLTHLSADSGVQVSPAAPAWASLLLPGTTQPPPLRQPTDPSLPEVAEPAWHELRLVHVCTGDAPAEPHVRATLEVHEHYPLRLEWEAHCPRRR